MVSTSHLAFIEQRAPIWLRSATPAQRRQLRERTVASHRASRAVSSALSSLQSVDVFCRPLLQDALTRWFPDMALPPVDEGRVWHHGRKVASSWLEAALQAVDADARLTLYANEQASDPLPLDTQRFVRGVRNLDLGQRYRYHLTDIVDNDAFRRLLREQDHTAFAADATLAALQGRLDATGLAMAEALLSGSSTVAQADGSRRAVVCNRLTVIGTPLRGPMLISCEPGNAIEPCLLYLPGHPVAPLRQYASHQAAATALTRLLWRDKEREFFCRYVTLAERVHFADALRARLYPFYPYDRVYARPPVLEPGQQIGWMKRLFPAPRALYQATLDKNARLSMQATPWQGDCFDARARTHVEGLILDAASIAVPVAQRDAEAQWALIDRWLNIGLSVLNVAALLVPGLGEVMLVTGGAQLVDTFLEGVEAANDQDAEAALSHLFDVLENVAQIAVLGAAATYSEPVGLLHEWIPVGQGASTKLWPGNLEPFAHPGGWPKHAPPLSHGPLSWQGRRWIDIDGQACAVEPAPGGGWRLARTKGQGHRPSLRQYGEGYWLLEHERPLGWTDEKLLHRAAPLPTDLEPTARWRALRCSGCQATSIRQALTDHQPLPAALLDSLEAFGTTLPAPVPRADEAPLKGAFPGLTPRARQEILAQARPADLARLQATQRVPQALAEAARLHLREGRLSRALQGFYLTAARADRDTLVFATLPRLTGWRASVQVRLLEAGEVVETTGDVSGPVKTLIRRGSQYQPYDEHDQPLANPTDLFQALLQALPDNEREALGLRIHEADGLRDRLFDEAATHRDRSARDLGMSVTRPWFRPPSRLSDRQAVGYVLSGRGTHGWLTGDEVFDQLFPATPETNRETLRAILRQEAGPQPGAFVRLMTRLQSEYQRLDESLQSWVSDDTGVEPEAQAQRQTARDSVAQSIRGAWRRQSVGHGLGSQQQVRMQINVYAAGGLPTLPDPLPWVRYMELTGMTGAHIEARLSDFLQAFPRLRLLDLSSNALRALPQHLGELHELESLNLSENELTLDDRDLGILANLQSLTSLGLTDAVSDLPPIALQRLAQLPVLRSLIADANELNWGASHFQALQQWPALEVLHLGQNQITLDPPTRQALSGLNRLTRLSLYENPLDLPPDLTGWTRLRQLDLEHTGIVEWPPGLLDLLNQRPLVLRVLDMGHNGLTEVPPLAHTALAEAMHAADPDLYIALGPNPWSEQALALMADAGIELHPVGTQHDWRADWPEPLRQHVIQTLADAHWQPLYELFDRLVYTGDYQHNPVAMQVRMSHIVQTLSSEATGDAAPVWGLAQLHQDINDRLLEAGQACVDQASLLFQEIETEVTTWETINRAQAGASHEQAAIDSAGALFRQRLLEEHVASLYQARVARRRALANADQPMDQEAAPPLHPYDDLDDAALTEPDYLLDELEMALYARIQLQTRLRLPPQPREMSFGHLARLSEPTLERLAAAVQEMATGERLAEWATTQRFWQAWLRRLYPQRFTELAQHWEGASAYFDRLSEAGPGAGPYEGLPVPEAYIAALEQAFAAVPGLTWRQDGVVQAVDFVSGRFANESAMYQQAAQLLLTARAADEAALYRTLSQALGQAYAR